MAEKILQTRILNKIDTLENWSKSSLKIKQGEICLATVAATAGNGLEEPVVMLKVGTAEEKTFAELPWSFYAKASDVLETAKDATKLTAFINSVIADAGIASSEAMEALAGRVTATETAITTLNGNDETAGSVAKAIKDAIAALKLDETYVAKEDGKSLIADTEIARLAAMSDGANKVEKSETNGNIKVDGAEVVVYTHPEKHAIDEVTGLQDAIDDAKKAGTDASSALDTYKGEMVTALAGKQDVIPENTYDAYGSAAAEKERAEGIEAGLQGAIDAINNTESGILAQAKAHADGKDEAIAAAKTSGDNAMAEAQAKVASVTAADASMTVAGTTTAPTVAVKLDPSADNAIKLNENGLKVEIGAAPEYTIVKAENSGDYAAVYNLTKDGTIVGASINIPKDMVVKSGSVVGDEIVLVLNDEAATEIKIPVASLIEYVTSGSATGDMVVVNVSDDHKVTATITDGTITLAKLTTEVQTAIGKAHSHENEAVLAGITADKVQAWDGAQAAAEATAAGALASAKSELEGKITAAQTAAEKVANDNNTAMNTRVEALEAIDHTHNFVESELNLIQTGDVAKWNAAEQNAKDHADGLNTTMDGRVAALEAAKNGHGDIVTHNVSEFYTKEQADAAFTDSTEVDGQIDAKITALDLANTYQAKGEYASAEQGGKADTAVQTVTASADSGLKATRTGNDIAIEIDDSIVWVFDCGDSTSV